MSEIREKFRPFLNKRIKVRGQLAKMRQNRKGVRACVVTPEIDGEVICDHIWVLRCEHWLQHQDKQGREVEFKAVVIQYDDHENGPLNYCLANPDELEFKNLPVLPIPDPPKKASPPNIGATSGAHRCEDDRQRDRLAVVREVNQFIKKVGNVRMAAQCAAAFSDLTISIDELTEWLAVLNEE